MSKSYVIKQDSKFDFTNGRRSIFRVYLGYSHSAWRHRDPAWKRETSTTTTTTWPQRKNLVGEITKWLRPLRLFFSAHIPIKSADVENIILATVYWYDSVRKWPFSSWKFEMEVDARTSAVSHPPQKQSENANFNFFANQAGVWNEIKYILKLCVYS